MTDQSDISGTRTNGFDYTILEAQDNYAQYFSHLSTAFQVLRKRCQSGGSVPLESETLAFFCERLLFSIEALRLKYLFHKDDRHSLWIDTSESGFPNQAEIAALEVDLATKEERLSSMLPETLLKQKILDYIFENHQEPRDLLAQLFERRYLEVLDRGKLFLQYTPGELRLVEKRPRVRVFNYWFGCYDFQSNRPYIHILTIEQPLREPSLSTDAGLWHDFAQIVESEGKRAPVVGVLAMSLDQALGSLRLKQLKRICFGPWYSRMLLEGREPNASDDREMVMRKVFERYKGRADDFLLFLTLELIFSKRQETLRTMLNPRAGVREIYEIDESDTRCMERKASLVRDIAILPHAVMQHLGTEGAALSGFEKAAKLVFDEQGQIHGS